MNVEDLKEKAGIAAMLKKRLGAGGVHTVVQCIASEEMAAAQKAMKTALKGEGDEKVAGMLLALFLASSATYMQIGMLAATLGDWDDDLRAILKGAKEGIADGIEEIAKEKAEAEAEAKPEARDEE